MMSPPKRSMVRRWGWLLTGFVTAVILTVVGIAATYPHELLTVDDGSTQADAVVVLGGGTDERPLRAAELFKEGVAPFILVSGHGDGVINARILEQAGVPPRAILIEPQSLSTLENARRAIPLLREKGAHRVIIVTSWYHSRRAIACFRRAAPDMQFVSRPAYGTYAPEQWRKHGTSPYISLEYAKLLGYWVCYGIPPW